MDRTNRQAQGLAPFLGAWRLVSAITDGQAAPADGIANVRVVIAEGSHTVSIGDQVVAHAIPFTIDLTVTPHQTTDHLPDGRQIKGISRVEGDTLTSCVAPIGQPAPETFAAPAGSGYTLRVFMRVTDESPARGV